MFNHSDTWHREHGTYLQLVRSGWTVEDAITLVRWMCNHQFQDWVEQNWR